MVELSRIKWVEIYSEGVLKLFRWKNITFIIEKFMTLPSPPLYIESMMLMKNKYYLNIMIKVNHIMKII